MRKEWLKKANPDKEDDDGEVKAPAAAKKRRHKAYVMNVTMGPILIPIIPDNPRGALSLGVLGEDERTPGIQDIRRFSDELLEECEAYMDFLENKFIVEIDVEEAKIRKHKIAEYQQKKKVAQQMRNQPRYADERDGTEEYGIPNFRQPRSGTIEEINLDENF